MSSDSLIYLSFGGGGDEGVVALSAAEHLESLLKISHFSDLYGTLNFNGHVIGGVDHPIKFSSVTVDDFMNILAFLKLQIECNNRLFESEFVTYCSLLSKDWNMQILPRQYLDAVIDLSTSDVVRYFCVCSRLSLYDLRQLFLYRLVYLQNQPGKIVATLGCIMKHTEEYELIVYQKRVQKLILASGNGFDKNCARNRSQSF